MIVVTASRHDSHILKWYHYCNIKSFPPRLQSPSSVRKCLKFVAATGDIG